jgi:hypothetical protein
MNLSFVQQIGPAHVGEQEIWLVSGIGPASYSQTTGDPVYPATGEFMQAPCGSALTPDGLYKVEFIPSGIPSLRPTWTAKWRYSGLAAGGADVITALSITSAGTGQTNGTYIVNGSGGTGTGSQAQITVAGGVITAATLLNPGSGYGATAPTFTPASGGTPGVVTATMTANAGQEVPSGVNLSAEVVQFAAVGGQI